MSTKQGFDPVERFFFEFFFDIVVNKVNIFTFRRIFEILTLKTYFLDNFGTLLV